MKKIVLSILVFNPLTAIFSQRVGINTPTPQETLDVNGNIYVNNKLGIAISPQFPLHFSSVLGDKVCFWGNAGNHYGIGIQGSLLQIHSATSIDDIAFGWGQSASFNELMRIKGTGNVGIGLNDPRTKLHVNGSISVGDSHTAASGLNSFAMGFQSSASGDFSMAVGSDTHAQAEHTMAFGYSCTASGANSFALGRTVSSQGLTSVAMGFDAKSDGDFSVAIGNHTRAKAYGSCSVGTDNDVLDTPDGTTPSPQDRIFQVGNGGVVSSNALTILRNGNVGIGTTVPGFLLNFPNALGDKVSFWGNSGGHYGIGIQSNQLQIHTDIPGSDILFGVGSSTSFTENMRIKGNGNVGIGTNILSEKLQVAGNIRATGNICGATISTCSDIRYKKDLAPIKNPLSSLLSLNGIYYYWKKDQFPEMQFNDKRQLGFSAQEVEKLFPELVITDGKGYKSVDYGRLTPVLVEAVKEQEKHINDQQEQINKQQKQIDELKSLVEKLVKQ